MCYLYMKMSFKWIITKAFSVDAIAADACVCSMIAFSPFQPMHAMPQRLFQPPFVLAGKKTMEKQWQRFHHIGILKRRWNFIQNFWFVYLYTHQVCGVYTEKIKIQQTNAQMNKHQQQQQQQHQKLLKWRYISYS